VLLHGELLLTTATMATITAAIELAPDFEASSNREFAVLGLA
jgi:hypothetical protein